MSLSNNWKGQIGFFCSFFSLLPFYFLFIFFFSFLGQFYPGLLSPPTISLHPLSLFLFHSPPGEQTTTYHSRNAGAASPPSFHLLSHFISLFLSSNIVSLLFHIPLVPLFFYTYIQFTNKNYNCMKDVPITQFSSYFFPLQPREKSQTKKNNNNKLSFVEKYKRLSNNLYDKI